MSAAEGQTVGQVQNWAQRKRTHCSEADASDPGGGSCWFWHSGGKITIPTASDEWAWLKTHRFSATNPEGIKFHETFRGEAMVRVRYEPGQPCLKYRDGQAPHGEYFTTPSTLLRGTPFGGSRQAIGRATDPIVSREWLDRYHEGTDALTQIRERGI